ncbi:MAG: ABC transporter ATP-binding protein [Deltaproteobacteria bacterium]|nr:ABC transporter ATP-binding protein [Deltaproteobacteria bacterium]
MLEIDDLRISYGKARAVDGVCLKVEEWESVAVIGPNGAGKSSLLRAVMGLTPASGRISFSGRDILGMKPFEIVRLGIVLCPEGRRLFPELTVRQNLEVGAYKRNDRKEIRRDLEKAFLLFPVLKKRETQMARSLSGGEQQMLAIARSLMGRPSLLMLDEPSMGLALLVKEDISRGILEINQEGVTILLVEQDVMLAMELTTRLYLLENGEVVIEGPVGEMAQDPHIKEAYLGIS